MKRAWLLIPTALAAVALAAATGAPAPGSAKPHKKLIQPAGSTALNLPFSPGLLVGDTLYLSGAIGADATGQLAAGGFEPEMRQAFTNAQATLKAAGMDYADVVSVTVYLADIKDFPQMNTIYKEYFKAEPLPTRSTVAVKDLVRGAKMEITMTAVRANQ